MTNPLTDVLPAKARKYVYAVLALAALVLAAYQATQGDWLAFAVALVGALTGGTAASNVNPEPPQ